MIDFRSPVFPSNSIPNPPSPQQKEIVVASSEKVPGHGSAGRSGPFHLSCPLSQAYLALFVLALALLARSFWLYIDLNT